MKVLRRLTALVDSCLLPTVRGRHERLPEWVMRSLENGTPGAAVDTRETADALRAALPDALTGHPGDPARHEAEGGGNAAAADLVAAGANLHLAVRPGRRADQTRVFVTDLQMHGVAAALGPFTAGGSLRPFAEGAAAGVRGITAGHTPVPGDEDLPAMLSARAVTGVLRGELGYGGVVLSDTLDAPSIVDGWGVPGAAVLAWIAGVDLVRLGPSSGAGVRDAIHAAAARAVADGDLPQRRLEEAAERVARLRRWASEPRMPAQEPAPAAGAG
ncbi:glycoside hydrolase family 3 N-terminal domain-containing protein [Actinacidiphila bryophytorum]|uniref:glycoside hydrolase family 3 N-terminal domain-containing protein n=1 Tax=Actinacidiphila bryophytorum TaxID=1436133 RepID=UPI0019610A5F|nr:glycoside hydrolase family 3 N-terminal domain-containing protein [Actinacidiphila bryophytorum]MBM9439352.1 hypothetical protein [Actinacidiphila bryophytorum]MBN6545777.1 hypothetical protein [Actinacidiphila bryophytorum]